MAVQTGKGEQMRNLAGRLSDWVVAHPVRWSVGVGAVLVLLGVALELAPIMVVAAGAVIGVLNVLHARRRGYCPLPAAQPSGQQGHSGRSEPVSPPST